MTNYYYKFQKEKKIDATPIVKIHNKRTVGIPRAHFTWNDF
jgi:hypothetical protein